MEVKSVPNGYSEAGYHRIHEAYTHITTNDRQKAVSVPNNFFFKKVCSPVYLLPGTAKITPSYAVHSIINVLQLMFSHQIYE